MTRRTTILLLTASLTCLLIGFKAARVCDGLARGLGL